MGEVLGKGAPQPPHITTLGWGALRMDGRTGVLLRGGSVFGLGGPWWWSLRGLGMAKPSPQCARHGQSAAALPFPNGELWKRAQGRPPFPKRPLASSLPKAAISHSETSHNNT